MRARRMRDQIKPVAVAVELVGVAVDPADRAAYLLDHRKQAPVGVIDSAEFEHDKIAAGAHERFGDKAVIGRAAGAPSAAMNEDRDRRFVHGLSAAARSGAINVEPLDRGRPISEAERIADARPRRDAVGDAPLGQLVAVWRIDELIVGVVERLLIHVEPDNGSLLLRPLGSWRVLWRGRRRGRSVHGISFPSPARPNTICSAANPATANRPTGCKPSPPQ